MIFNITVSVSFINTGGETSQLHKGTSHRTKIDGRTEDL